MAKIIVEITSGLRGHKDYKIFNSEAIRVGRGFDNDVILNDPHVSERHLVITSDGEKIAVKDLQSRNGTYSSRTNQAVGESTIVSGEELVLGKTRIRVYLDSHAVAPARALIQTNKFFQWIQKPAMAWGLLLILLAWTLLEAHFATTKNEPLVKLLPSPIVTFCIIFVWAGFWSFVGRLVQHHVHFFVHISIGCLWFLVYGVLKNFNDYIGFYAGSPWLHMAGEYLLYALLLAMTLYFSLTFATGMADKQKAVFSSIFTLLLVGSITGLHLSASEYYPTGAPYDTLLKPPIFGVRPAHSIEQFVTSSEELFEFETEK